MVEEQLRTKGQIIDMGDEMISSMIETKTVVDATLVDVVDKFRRMIKLRIDDMVKLGCFPKMRIAEIDANSGDMQNIREVHFLEINTLEKTPNDKIVRKTVLDLRADLFEVEMKYSGYNWFIKADSMLPFSPSRYIPFVHPVIDTMVATIRSAQEPLFFIRQEDSESN